MEFVEDNSYGVIVLSSLVSSSLAACVRHNRRCGEDKKAQGGLSVTRSQ